MEITINIDREPDENIPQPKDIVRYIDNKVTPEIPNDVQIGRLSPGIFVAMMNSTLEQKAYITINHETDETKIWYSDDIKENM